MKSSVKKGLDSLQLSDIYSLLLFMLYKLEDVPEYAVLSELCYLLDGANLTRLLTFFAGKTITIPTAEEFVVMSEALLVYQYVMIDKMSLIDAKNKLVGVTPNQWDAIVELYLKIVPVMSQYNIDTAQVANHE